MKYFLALAAGVASVTAFSPFDWWPVLLLAQGILFYLWRDGNARVGFTLGFCFGLGQFGFGVSWVYVSIQVFGGMPPVLAGVCVLGFIALLALFPALAGWTQAYLGGGNTRARLLLVIPSSWIFWEWVRSWIFTGLPWLSTGYAMLDTPLAGFAPLGGVYLVGLIVTLSVVSLLAFDKSRPVVWMPLIMVTVIWVSGFWLQSLSWSQRQGEPVNVAIVQNNVPLLDKWGEANRSRIIAEYFARSDEHRDKDLVVWPEGAVPDYLENLDPAFWARIQDHPADFAFGTLHQPRGGTEYFNTIVAAGKELRLYNKQHLVPFGEFFPMQGLLDPILRHLTIPMAAFSPWQGPQEPLPLAGHLAAVSICYEDAFPHEWRNQVAEAGFLLNVSEDMWFGDSLAPHQRLQMARFRARESERPMIRSSNNGLSSLIDWRGSVTVAAPQFAKAVTTGSIEPRTGITPFIRFGDWPVLGVIAIMLLAGLLFGRVSLGYNAPIR